MPEYRFETGATHHGILFSEDALAGIPAVFEVKPDGATFTIAFLPDRATGSAPTSWFRNNGQVPDHLVFRALNLRLTCFGVRRWTQHGGDVSVATIEPISVIADLWHGDHNAQLTAMTVRSELDHLHDWTRFQAASFSSDTDERDRIQRLTIELATRQQLVWAQGDASMKLTTTWEPTPGLKGVHYDDVVILESSFADERAIEDHMLEQRKVRDLLVLMYSTPAFFRRHQMRSQFVHDSSDRSADPYHHAVDLIGGQVTRELSQSAIRLTPTDFAISYPGQFGPTGFESWSREYVRFERVIRPLVRMLQRAQASVEDRILAVGIALEAGGVRIPPVAGESGTYRKGSSNVKGATVATYVFRVLSTSGIATEYFAETPAGLARGISQTYNAIKHPDKDLPSAYQGHGVATLGLLALQIYLAKDALGYPDAGSERYGDHFVNNTGLLWDSLGLYCSDAGDFVPRPEENRF